jgi:hypothetical protein
MKSPLRWASIHQAAMESGINPSGYKGIVVWEANKSPFGYVRGKEGASADLLWGILMIGGWF